MEPEFTLTPFIPPSPKDDRFTRFRTWIEKAYQWKWNMQPRWGGMEAKNLWSLLAEKPDLTEKQFCIALKNLLNSDDIPPMQRPGYWLPKLDSYTLHAHNVYGRRQDGNATAHAAERFLDKKRDNLGVPSTPGAAVDVQQNPKRVGLRALGFGSNHLLKSGD